MDFPGSYVLPDSIYTTPKLKQYCNFGSTLNYKKGEAVFKPGDILNRLGYILSGTVRVAMVSDDGQEQLLYTAGPGNLLGLLFGRKDEPTYVTALESCTICFFTGEQIKAVCAHDPDVILELLHNNIQKTGYFMSQLASRKWFSADIRILQLIYHIALERGIYRDGRYEVNIKLTQKTISEITGVHFVTVSRCLKQLKEMGIAEKVKNGFIIHDLERLNQLIESRMIDSKEEV